MIVSEAISLNERATLTKVFNPISFSFESRKILIRWLSNSSVLSSTCKNKNKKPIKMKKIPKYFVQEVAVWEFLSKLGSLLPLPNSWMNVYHRRYYYLAIQIQFVRNSIEFRLRDFAEKMASYATSNSIQAFSWKKFSF